ncbi:MAG: glutamate synthase large subunit [Gammaproteobacteria bacterium]|nr:glutamate synthase large subunit [Gammaproteobacteria bacterium]
MDAKNETVSQGLYDSVNEHDSCGVGFIADIKNRKSHKIVRDGLTILANLTHRGAVGADPLAGDGAGILIQVPDRLMRSEAEKLGFGLPAPGEYAVGMVFMPRNDSTQKECEFALELMASEEGQTVLGWRDVPTDNACLGFSVKPKEPMIRQFFIGRGDNCADTAAFERKLFVIRKRAHFRIRKLKPEAHDEFYVASMSTSTLLYKGMVLAANLPNYFLDLNDERVESALALVHQRFSTNTFPSWELAQPFRYLCHNGEINTVRGNINWMLARRANMRSELMGEDLEKLWPLIGDGNSDSATFDNALELLVAGGYSLVHAVMLMIPEAWLDNPLMDDNRRAFYEYHAALMEPWDGPAAVAFTDGRQIGATLDRNGLRPARYLITDDDTVVMASEMGVLDIPEEKIVKKWRLQPGKMFLIDLEQGRIIDDEELKEQLAGAKPYQQWLDQTQIKLEDVPAEVAAMAPDPSTLLDRQQAFGYTREDIDFFLKPMAVTGQDPVGAMGRDVPPAVLSHRAKNLFDYFKQNFAQVTNPPIDPIREELVMSLVSLIGPRPNLLDLKTGGKHKRLEVHQPILSSVDLEKIRRIEDFEQSTFRTYTLELVYPASEGTEGMEEAIDHLCEKAGRVVRERGYNILILSDRGVDTDSVAIPALLATGAVHHYLIREGLRTDVGIVVETGEARQVHDFCLLAGYGAEAINPYLALDSITQILPQLDTELSVEEAHNRYIKAIDKGMLKVMSKMGISTYQSYCGAQIFDAVGLSRGFVDKYFYGTATAIEGVGLDEIAEETVRRHRAAYGDQPALRDALEVGGELAFRHRGENHVWTPETISLLQHAVRSDDYGKYRQYAEIMNRSGDRVKNLRGLFEFKFDRDPVPIEEVEPASEIVKRFATGAMSFGSISWEAHTTLAIAMNRLGGRSNTGEGGEEAERFGDLPNGDSMRSRVKQIASGRFGVTAEYLVSADDIQIKMAQGAKPGEGGQLPGHKVNEWIARVRHSTPGVGLISPPPHHDIYSIEDLAQLIHDLKNVNPEARISVKLVSEVGVGTVAAGVTKAHADHVLISGSEGGTGASPLTSTMHAGSEWEIGLAETHQTLVLNDLRGRIAVQADGGMRTGRDVVIAALLGADEVGFGTIALIAEGCIMMRKCHLNTCPVGVATQDSELRKRFTARPEDVVNFFMFIAEDVREWMARLGYRNYSEMIGHADRLDVRQAERHWKTRGLDFSGIFTVPDAGKEVAIFNCESQDHGLEQALDRMLIEKTAAALERGEAVRLDDVVVTNVNRSVGAMLSGEIARRYGHEGLPNDTIYIKACGNGGQSFGAFLASGITLELQGEANDYTGKGLSGGRIIVYPPADTPIKADENIIIGNTVLYGAIEGEVFFSGVAGERFCVRNSGATAVVEGVGDHGCEYMTGGCVVVLGNTGRNFAAGMSGGVAYVLDEDGMFEKRCNLAMVELEPIADEAEALESTDHQGGDMETHGLVDLMHDLSSRDEQRLRLLIEKHRQLTGSAKAGAILESWENFRSRFVKVMPVEYRKALQKMQDQANEAASPDASVAVGA